VPNTLDSPTLPAIGASPPKGSESIFMNLNPVSSALPPVVPVAISLTISRWKTALFVLKNGVELAFILSSAITANYNFFYLLAP
jgi:hypothetical protein